MITMSKDIKDISVALIALQSELKEAPKNAVNPYFHSKYADLSSVISTAKDALTKNDLAITQLMEETDGSLVKLTTMLVHKSGQYITSTITLRPKATDPQGMGSAITYARRYQYMAIIGMAAEDDDGATASDTTTQNNEGVGIGAVVPTAKQNTMKPQATPKQVKFIITLLARKGKQLDRAKELYKVEHLTDLTTAQASDMIDKLSKLPDVAPDEPPVVEDTRTEVDKVASTGVEDINPDDIPDDIANF